METTIFRVHKRFESFWRSDESKFVKSPRFAVVTSLWFFSFFIMGLAWEYDFKYLSLYIIATTTIWFILNRDIFRHLKPPTELIILIFISFYAIEIALYKLTYNPQTLMVDKGIISTFFHLITLAMLTLLFGFIIIDNNNRKQGILIFYVLMGFIGHEFLFFEGKYLFYVYQLILFFSLFKRTSWLEKLTRTELWLYLIFFIALYYFHGTLPITPREHGAQTQQSVIWVSMPLYISNIYRLYLLTMIIKSPIILIYNHAALAKKLRMSALFQSTVPQLIQFVMLLVVFFLFISGWQAQNVRMALYHTIEQLRQREVPENVTYFLIPYEEESRDLIRVPGCYPQKIDSQFPSLGVVSMECLGKEGRNTSTQFQYYIVARELLVGRKFLLLIRLDEALFDHITKNLNLLAASYLYTYSYVPEEWQTRLYRLDFWQKDDRIKIYPFVFSTYDEEDAGHFKLKDITESGQSFILESLENIFGHIRFVTGRIFIPLLNKSQTDHYYLLDLVSPIQAQSLSSPMIRMFLLLVGLYILFNLFVLQRVIQFGEQINKIIVRKFSQLRAGIREISTGNLDYQVEIDGEDEFVELAQRFNYMRRQLKHSMEESREKERLNQELRIARDVQFSFLPTDLPDVPGYKIVASLKTAQEVSGDFYDLIQIDDVHYLFTIGDVSGKGSSAAFYMAQMMSLLRFSLQFTRKPEEIALRINQYFTKHSSDRQVFVTAIIGIIDLEKDHIRLVRAGHTPPILIPREDDIREQLSDGMALGLTPVDKIFKKELKALQISLAQGESLFLYTDGVTEATIKSEQDDKEEIFGEERLFSYLYSSRSTNIHALHDGLIKTLDTFRAGQPRMDDQTILLIQKSTTPGD